jgi:hypothetical protein
MTNDTEQLQSTLNSVLQIVQTPFWKQPEFWISLIVGIIVGGIGIYYAFRAFKEAGEAKKAAKAAGRTVKFQNIAIELRELKLGTLSENIQFTAARDLLSDTTQKLHQILCPFEKEPQFSDKITKLFEVLQKTRESLNLVKPSDEQSEREAPQAIYYAIENQFATMNELKGDLTGLFEQKTTNFGDDNATT